MSDKPKITTFTDSCNLTKVKSGDILKDGDWLLKWSEKDSDLENSGFSLFTPVDFDPSKQSGPLGGLLLAAFYFLLEHSDSSFHKEIIARANALSKVMEEAAEESEHKTLN
jgi:hypothetical protein